MVKAAMIRSSEAMVRAKWTSFGAAVETTGSGLLTRIRYLWRTQTRKTSPMVVLAMTSFMERMLTTRSGEITKTPILLVLDHLE